MVAEVKTLTMVKCIQINLGKRASATGELNLRLEKGEADIVFIQEPCKKLKGLSGGTTFCSSNLMNKQARSAIWIKKEIVQDLECLLIEQFSNRNMTTVEIKLKNDKGSQKKILLCSVYLPSLDDDKHYINNPIDSQIEDVVDHCGKSNVECILAGDFNAHSIAWGSDNDDVRGKNILEFLTLSNLRLLNCGSAPTFLSGLNGSIIDLTLSSPLLSRSITKWKVDERDSLSDHRAIYFEITSCRPTESSQHVKKKTDWIKYKSLVEKDLENFRMNLDNINDFDQTAKNFSDILREAFNKCCVSKKFKGNFHTSWYSNQLNSLRKEVRAKLKKALDAKNRRLTSSIILLEEYRKVRNDYNKKCSKAKSESWKKKMSEMDDIKDISRLQKILESDNSANLGTLLKPDGIYTQDKDETIRHLMETHFPQCMTITADEYLQFHVRSVSEEQLIDIDKTVDEGKIAWAINSLMPYKAPGEDGIFPALLQKVDKLVTPILRDLFRTSLKFGFIPLTWRGTFVTFIPKAGKERYDQAKSFRPISLMSFILKILEKLIDRRIRDIELKDNMLHNAQHAYQAGKGTESALHSLITDIEKQFPIKGSTMAVFIDIQGAFDNTNFNVIAKAARVKGISSWAIAWIECMLKSRTIKATIDEKKKSFIPTRGCPQGGCLSPLLWCLVVDPLIRKLRNAGLKVLAYADDLVIYCHGNKGFHNIQCDQLNKAMRIVEQWCEETGLTVNPEKSQLMRFSTATKDVPLSEVYLFNKIIDKVENTKYLGVYLDSKLSWNKHIDLSIDKSRRSLWATKAMVAKNWGINPKKVVWIYKQIIQPRLTYGALVWWHKAQSQANTKKLCSLQRIALMLASGATKSTPSAALEAALNVCPSNIKIKSIALAGCLRLKSSGTWRKDAQPTLHRAIENELGRLGNYEEDDSCPITWHINKFTAVVNERNNWSYGLNIRNNPYCWYTDGSKKEDRVGFGIHNPVLNVNIAERISGHGTIMQAEVKGIEQCAIECIKRQITGKNILILTDSQAAIKAINRPLVNSRSVDICVDELNTLATNNSVKIAWIPSHSGWYGNEKADKLANEGASKPQINFHVRVTRSSLAEKITNWERKQAVLAWENIRKKYKHSDKYVRGHETKIANFLLSCSRRNIRILIGILTGHGCLNKYLMTIGKRNNDMCRYCKEIDSVEDMSHIIRICPALQAIRQRTLGTGTPSEEEIRNIDYRKLLNFADESKLTLTFFRDPTQAAD